MKKIKVGIIGLGERGMYLLKNTVLLRSDIQVVAVCDTYEDRVEKAQELCEEKKGVKPLGFTDYRQVLALEEIEIVFVYSSWSSHIKISIEAMKAGKAVGCEVGGAYSIEECWELVETQELTGRPFMMLENCCYDIDELTATNMARKGIFGEIVHCSGAYAHDLRKEVADGEKNRHYRFNEYLTRNCDNYPTHELGPIAKLLNINRGNRMVSLVSMASKAAGLKEFINEYRPELAKRNLEFKQADIVITLIKCANGETIMLKLDTTLPVLYDRAFTVRGTKGNYIQTTQSVFMDGDCHWMPGEKIREVVCNQEKYKEHVPAVWANITEEEKAMGHGGMDGIVLNSFLEAYKNNEEMPIDVYDAATWMSISALTEQSIKLGSELIEVPDFTKGTWKDRPQKDVIKLG